MRVLVQEAALALVFDGIILAPPIIRDRSSAAAAKYPVV
jgi:hypothetical protein